MQDITRSYTGSYLRDAGDGLMQFRFSTDGVDRHRSIVVPSGIDTSRFGRAFLWGHDRGSMLGGSPDIRNILGSVEGLRVVPFERDAGEEHGEALEGGVRFASKINPRAKFAEAMVRGGFLGQTSISFLRKPGGTVMRTVKGHKDKVEVHEKTELLEISLVGVPSNPEVAALVRSMASEIIPAEAVVPAVLAEYGKVPFDRKTGMPTAEEIVRLLLKELEGRSESRAAPPPVSGADIGKAVRRWRSRSRRDRAIRARA
jgi:hypothetical protein